MTNEIFRSTVFVAAVVLLCSLSVVMGALYDYFDAVQVNQLKDELNLDAIGTEESGLAFLEKVDSNRFRVTWIASFDLLVLVCTVIVGALLHFDKCANKKENREKANLLSEILLHPRNARCSSDYCPSEHRALAVGFLISGARTGHIAAHSWRW